MLKPLTVSPSAPYSQLSLGKCLLLFVEYRAICIDPRTDFWSDVARSTGRISSWREELKFR